MIRTKLVTLEADPSIIAGRCTGFRLRPTFAPASDWKVYALTNQLAEFGAFPVEVVPVDTRGRALDPIIVTGPEFFPLPDGVSALKARHLYPVERLFRMTFLIDIATKAGEVLDTARNPAVMTTVYDGGKVSDGGLYQVHLPTFGLDAIVLAVTPDGVGAVADLLFLDTLASYPTSEWGVASVNIAAGVTQLFIVGPRAQALPAVPAAVVVQVPLPSEVLLSINQAPGSVTRVRARVALG